MIIESNKVLGSRLKEARERRNLKQNRVAKIIGIHNSTLAKYESDTRDPDTDTLTKLAELYDVSIDWLKGRENKTKTISDIDRSIVERIYELPEDEKHMILGLLDKLKKH
jgi:transcriptional regulator with XRE-family HTH domain